MKPQRSIERWTAPQECCDAAWESAYVRFETPEEEIRKFMSRLRGFGVERWSRDLQIVEIFCGRGSGLEAWRRLGFRQLEGVDISEALLTRYAGAAQLYVGDCRRLQFQDASRDVVCVQGGMHHLPTLPEDLLATVAEVWRVLRPGGRFIVVEPWSTPFLALVHGMCRQSTLRAAWRKIDALACMIEREQKTYFNWLSRPETILNELQRDFETEVTRTAWGKLSWMGRKPGGAVIAVGQAGKEMQSTTEK
jgi:ubiquinone/menaquinone biosynthesis C-methylase UbiE